MKNKKIAIVGTRGIPNLYGGFEQFAEYVSVGLVKIGYDVIVYSPFSHPYKEAVYQGVKIVRKCCPEGILGSVAHIFYDFFCLRDAVNQKVDVVLELGYQSSAISMLVCSYGDTRVITNMDGLEWKRTKWSPMVQRFTRWAERIGVQQSHRLVADNQGIQDYIWKAYHKESTLIPYGAELFDRPDEMVLEKYDVSKNEYFILIARMEPENNIETILDGYCLSKSPLPFIVIGNFSTAYGAMLYSKYDGGNVRFVGGVYDINVLNNLRYFSNMYFHGHSVGGTNPSLLEAMASHSLIAAHSNVFNRAVLGDDALYFSNQADVVGILQNVHGDINKNKLIDANLTKIRDMYSWSRIVEQYAALIESETA
ncbi:RfaG Glycosyltransferase [Methylophilaceae bacterium]